MPNFDIFLTACRWAHTAGLLLPGSHAGNLVYRDTRPLTHGVFGGRKHARVKLRMALLPLRQTALLRNGRARATRHSGQERRSPSSQTF